MSRKAEPKRWTISGARLQVNNRSTRRDGRADEGGGLENRYSRKWIVGSNPTPSAIRGIVLVYGPLNLRGIPVPNTTIRNDYFPWHKS